MYTTLFLLAVSGPQLAPGQFPGTQHPNVWYYNSHNIPVPWPANSYFTLTMNTLPGGPGVPADSSTQVVTSWAAPPNGPAPATLVVRLPADARLTIDGYPPRSTSGTRWFVTPPLEPGRTFHYELRAEVERGGKRLTQTRQVAVRAGQESNVTIDFPGPSVAGR
jgi:uncharacterized protein (TIGR03000 family)